MLASKAIQAIAARLFILGIWMIVFTSLPVVAASPGTETQFPTISFSVFSDFISHHFSSKISLATVLVMLLTLTENPELLNLHARQQNPRSSGEKRTLVSGWMKSLAHGVKTTVQQNDKKLLKKKDSSSNADEEITTLGIKLDALAKLLHSFPRSGPYAYIQ
jgi:hypothetical protein